MFIKADVLGYHQGSTLRTFLPISLEYVYSFLQLDVIGIDEAQFFEDLYDFCREAADRDGKILVVAGLDGDYLR